MFFSTHPTSHHRGDHYGDHKNPPLAIMPITCTLYKSILFYICTKSVQFGCTRKVRPGLPFLHHHLCHQIWGIGGVKFVFILHTHGEGVQSHWFWFWDFIFSVYIAVYPSFFSNHWAGNLTWLWLGKDKRTGRWDVGDSEEMHLLQFWL